MEIKARKKERDISLEIMRIVAILFVIFIHTGDSGYFLFSTYDVGSIRYWLYMPLSVFSNFAVPLFFMISGVVLLKKDESLKKVLTKRVLRIAIVIILINLIYYLFDLISGSIPFCGVSNLFDFGFFLLSGKIRPFIWFLYSYLVFLLILPFLRKIVLLSSKRDFRYLFLISITVMVIKPVFELLSNNTYEINNAFNVLITNVIIFPVFGFSLYYSIDIRKIALSKIVLLWIINLICIAVSCLLVYYRMIKTGETLETQAQQFHNMFSIINASVIFLTTKKVFSAIKAEKVKMTIFAVSECVFGVYLFHVLVMNLDFVQSIKQFFTSNTVIPLIMCFVYCFFVFLLSFLISFILKKIPVIKSFL